MRIWNFQTRQMELCKYFPEAPLSVSMHPLGLYIVVGFADKLRCVCAEPSGAGMQSVGPPCAHVHRLMSVLSDDIRTIKELPLKSCTEVSATVIR